MLERHVHVHVHAHATRDSGGMLHVRYNGNVQAGTLKSRHASASAKRNANENENENARKLPLLLFCY
jgi:hypothetical protein